jgi:hypothetical protein
MKKKPWTRKEISILKQCYPLVTFTASDIGKMLGRSRSSVKAKAHAMGISGTNNHWTKEEDELIRANYGDRNISIDQIADMLPGRKSYAVSERASILNISRREDWTKEEDEILIEFYGNPAYTVDDFDELLPRRTREAIKARASSLNLTSPHRENQEKLIRSLYLTYQSKGAKQRGLCFSISFEEFSELIRRPCHYCGRSNLGSYTRHDWGTLCHNGIDRINPDKGYEIGNVLPCCKHCNRAKRDMEYSEFRKWIKMVYLNWAQNDGT